MASKTVQAAGGAFRFAKRKTRFDVGLGLQLPEAYKKFWKEWKVMQPAAVHYIPKEGKWNKDPLTERVFPIQNVPIPVKYPPEHNEGIWGGEGVVKGFQKRHRYDRRVPHFWVPLLQRSVVRSEVLNVHLSIIMTDRTLKLIHDNYGFDHYLLKTPACDLKSSLALKLKKKILEELSNNCPAYKDQPEKQKEIYEEYKSYLSAYTTEEIEWYGLTWEEAILKITKKNIIDNAPKPLKHEFRSKLIEQLKTGEITVEKDTVTDQMPGASWMSKINPFGKKRET